jgi:hypothetical protein
MGGRENVIPRVRLETVLFGVGFWETCDAKIFCTVKY